MHLLSNHLHQDNLVVIGCIKRIFKNMSDFKITISDSNFFSEEYKAGSPQHDSSPAVGHDGSCKIENVSQDHSAETSPKLCSDLEKGKGFAPKKNVTFSGVPADEVRSFVDSSNEFQPIGKEVKQTQTSSLSKEKLLSFNRGLSGFWKSATYAPKFTRALVPTKYPDEDAREISRVRNEYKKSDGSLDGNRLEARVARCVDKGDFKEIESMIKAFSAVDAPTRMQVDKNALTSIRNVLSGLEENASGKSKADITKLLESKEFN